MDVKLNESTPWKKIRPEKAMDAKKNRVAPSREDRVELDSAAIQSFLVQGPQNLSLIHI